MKQSLPNLRYYPGIYLETEENQENRSQDSRSPSQYLNPGPPVYKAGVLTTRPQRSVIPDYKFTSWKVCVKKSNVRTNDNTSIQI
jgi:hypothetical protein